ncbi:MAG: hypothetical protein A2888_01445 [Chlamydiae bacterium RIFCSPLOWO2_01_FULL_28_7]|nr:MAG: hypothetical protein A2888_01445 [Chlamydiae bacterium RIFCSPLOWO2_01_FULL_28_7]
MAKITEPIEPNDSNELRASKISEKGFANPPDKSTFETFKEQAPSAVTQSTASGISPMELAQKSAISQAPTYQTILAQTQNTRDTLGEIEKQLKTPDLKLKKSHQELLNTKLTNANEHLDDANNILNAKETKPSQIPGNANPAVKFLGYITDGQNKLVEAQNQLSAISNSNKEMRPADMLLIQVKLSQAQQEIEYSTVLLSKVIDSLKQILNIQL